MYHKPLLKMYFSELQRNTEKYTFKQMTYCNKDRNDDDSVFSASRFFVAVIQIFIPVHEL